jgi:hypothetical protein
VIQLIKDKISAKLKDYSAMQNVSKNIKRRLIILGIITAAAGGLFSSPLPNQQEKDRLKNWLSVYFDRQPVPFFSFFLDGKTS